MSDLSKPESARPVQDLPMYWQGRANALRMLEERRLVPDRATLWQADAFEECANELRAALAIPAQSTLNRDAVRRLDRECLETLNVTEDGDPDANLVTVLKRGFAATGWAQPSLAADEMIDAIMSTSSPAQGQPSGTHVERIERALWEAIDLMASTLEKPDPRVWDHLKVYQGQPSEDDQQEAAMFAEEAADNMRLIDHIADKIGQPHDQELTTETFDLWLSAQKFPSVAPQAAPAQTRLSLDPEVVAAAQQAIMKNPLFRGGSSAWAFGLANSALKGALVATPSVTPQDGIAEALRLLRKISDLVDAEDVGEPLDDAISYANKAIAALTSGAAIARHSQEVKAP